MENLKFMLRSRDLEFCWISPAYLPHSRWLAATAEWGHRGQGGRGPACRGAWPGHQAAGEAAAGGGRRAAAPARTCGAGQGPGRQTPDAGVGEPAQHRRSRRTEEGPQEGAEDSRGLARRVAWSQSPASSREERGIAE